MGGTNIPEPSKEFIDTAVASYIQSTNAACVAECDPHSVSYLAQWWPVTGMGSSPWDVSVASGVSSLDDQVVQVPVGDVVIFGYSQGAQVASVLKSRLAAANGVVPERFTFVFTGNPIRPNGGVFQRFGTETAPSTESAMAGINTVDIALQ